MKNFTSINFHNQNGHKDSRIVPIINTSYVSHFPIKKNEMKSALYRTINRERSHKRNNRSKELLNNQGMIINKCSFEKPINNHYNESSENLPLLIEKSIPFSNINSEFSNLNTDST